MKNHFSGFSNFLLAVGIAVAMASRADASHLTFSNTAPITINDNASATPYPSTITLGSLGILDVNVTVTGLTHGFPEDIGILLVGPGGQKVVLMNNTGGINPITVPITITFDDQAATSVPNPIFGTLASGTYKPTNLAPACPGNSFNPPAPACPYGTSLSAFNGNSPAGVWSLYVEDFAAGDSGLINGGWTLLVTTPEPSPLLLLGLGLVITVSFLRRLPH
jgi:subtilisin-like proprotein convertase family protein